MKVEKIARLRSLRASHWSLISIVTLFELGISSSTGFANDSFSIQDPLLLLPQNALESLDSIPIFKSESLPRTGDYSHIEYSDFNFDLNSKPFHFKDIRSTQDCLPTPAQKQARPFRHLRQIHHYLKTRLELTKSPKINVAPQSMPVITPETRFVDRFTAETQYPNIGFNSVIQKKLKGRQLLAVGGFLNEAAVGGIYFKELVSECKRLGIVANTYWPSSRSPIAEDAEKLYEHTLKLYAQNQKPIIMVGHSKGGVAIRNMLYHHPELILAKIVDRVALIQPALRGSILADDDSLKKNVIVDQFKKILGLGFQSLRPGVAARVNQIARTAFQKSMEKKFGSPDSIDFQQAYEQVSNRVYSIHSSLPSKKKPSLGLRIVSKFFKKSFSDDRPNDRLLEVHSQKLNSIEDKEKFGVDIELEGDHLQHVAAFVSRSTTKERQAFSRSLIQILYQNDKLI